jgi:ferric-dicitrate binding protein FerR (iron transport regulator)
MVRLMGRVIAVALFALISAPTALAADWFVAQLSGTVWLVAPDASAQQASVGSVVEPGWTVGTGPESRVLLVHGEESMALGPNTTMMFRTLGRSTLVTEQEGAITFEVDERNVRNFTVQTPVLAAVVKGTTFTVSVTSAGSLVTVAEGTVEVRAFAGGERTLVSAGQTAAVSAGHPGLLVAAGAGHMPPFVEALVGGGPPVTVPLPPLPELPAVPPVVPPVELPDIPGLLGGVGGGVGGPS